MLGQITGLISEKGILGTMRYVPKRLLERARQRQEREYDQRFHVHTSGITQLKHLEFDSPNRTKGHRYEGVPIGQFRRVLDQLDIRFEDYTFIDYGSGKGRALFLA